MFVKILFCRQYNRLWGNRSEYSAPSEELVHPFLKGAKKEFGKLVFYANRAKKGEAEHV